MTATDEKSIVPKAVIFTPVTLSDQPIVALPYHIGMEAMSFARSASASWYFALAAAGSVAAAASNAKYQEAEALLAKDMASIPLWYYTTQMGWSDKVTGVNADAFGRIDLTSVSVK